jgi:hypothetical protein
MTVDPFPELRAADDLADTSRFTVIPVPDEAGLTGQVRLVIDRATGRRWFAKAATADFDAANEVICARLAQALGLARPRAAFAVHPLRLELRGAAIPTLPDAAPLFCILGPRPPHRQFRHRAAVERRCP